MKINFDVNKLVVTLTSLLLITFAGAIVRNTLFNTAANVLHTHIDENIHKVDDELKILRAFHTLQNPELMRQAEEE